MYRSEKTRERQNPSFSSYLLDEIYRSIDDVGDKNHGEFKSKQSKVCPRSNRTVQEEEMGSLRLIEKWMEKKIGEKTSTQQRRQSLTTLYTKSQNFREHDHDVLFFSSTSTSSDSSSGGFSSSDTESMYAAKSRSSCFAPPTRPKPVRTSVSARSEKTERTLVYEQREMHMFDDYHYNSGAEHTPKLDESIIKSKSRALKIYNNLKKVKQPISPGGRLSSFINSLFTASNTKKTKSSSSIGACSDKIRTERKLYSGQESTCSSASSFSRSCLSKHSPSTREKLRSGDKRTVRFYPVSVIVDEDCRPCGHKCLYEEDDAALMSVSVPTAWKIGRSETGKNEAELNFKKKNKRVEEAARDFLKEYHQNQMKNDLITRNLNDSFENEDDDEDDAASYSSSDLFELDHNRYYYEELPVYETTHVNTNRAIANGLIM